MSGGILLRRRKSDTDQVADTVLARLCGVEPGLIPPTEGRRVWNRGRPPAEALGGRMPFPGRGSRINCSVFLTDFEKLLWAGDGLPSYPTGPELARRTSAYRC